jgi:hypothetical protein
VVGYSFGSPELGIAQFRTKQGERQPIISVMNSNSDAVSTSKQATIGFYATDGSTGDDNGKYMGSVGFHPTDQDVIKNDFRINQVLNNLKPPTDVFTITEDANTRFDFKGQGQYPTIRLKGTDLDAGDDATYCFELGRNNANGNGLLRLGNNGLSDGAGILLRGSDFSHINGGNLGIGIGTGTPSEKLEVVGNIKTTNGEVKIPNDHQVALFQSTINVNTGNPLDSNYNNLGGSLENFLFAAVTTAVNNAKVLINCVINGEWANQEENKGVVLVRRADFGSNAVTILRPAQSGSRGRLLSGFCVAWHQDTASTLERSVITFVDKITTSDGIGTYDYFPVLVNAGTVNTTFHFNKTVSNQDYIWQEIASSCISVQVLST